MAPELFNEKKFNQMVESKKNRRTVSYLYLVNLSSIRGNHSKETLKQANGKLFGSGRGGVYT